MPRQLQGGRAVTGRLWRDGEGGVSGKAAATRPTTDPLVLGAEGNESIKNGQEGANLKE